jgi:hypothetical protein
MHSREFLIEAETNIKVKKADQLLDQLSDQDLVLVAKLLQGSLEEAVQDLMVHKKAGKRIEGRPSDFIAYDDGTKTAKRYLETNNGLQVSDVRYKPPPHGYTAPALAVAPAPVQAPEVKQYVASLDNKEKEALLNAVKKESKKRKSEPKKSEPKKSSSGKVVAGVLAGLLALGIYLSPDYEPNKNNTTSQQTTVQDKQPDANKKFMKQAENGPYKIARQIRQTAFDEGSLKFRNWKMNAVKSDDGGVWLIITGEVNGKNRYGAYVGYKNFFASIDPDSGEVQKLYTEGDPKYAQAVALIKSFKDISTAPLMGPS